MLTLTARAKVNLGLWVGPSRPDGFHGIVTIIAPIALADTVAVRLAARGIEVRTDDPSLPADEENLAGRAARAFLQATGRSGGCRVTIRKRIPVGAGLGGGSADAAAVLNGMNRLCGGPLSPLELRRVGAGVGSDVPALLAGRPCVARGRGELVRTIRLPRLRLLLYLPGFPVSTAWAYRRLDQLRRREPGLTAPPLSPKILALRLRRQEPAGAARLFVNSFEPAVFRRYPVLGRARSALLRCGCVAAALSGSGSTVFGVVTEKSARGQDPMAALARIGFPCTATSTTT
ncbi:MAG: 4-(cytidine 5'-diphospho)-2-C-methyl-D-erythritol kinase [bacterium]